MLLLDVPGKIGGNFFAAELVPAAVVLLPVLILALAASLVAAGRSSVSNYLFASGVGLSGLFSSRRSAVFAVFLLADELLWSTLLPVLLLTASSAVSFLLSVLAFSRFLFCGLRSGLGLIRGAAYYLYADVGNIINRLLFSWLFGMLFFRLSIRFF
ncbi:MAG: hypothetical protein IKI73_02030 [Firmicutes bacterium]|nr:hypothetical protein [Bacillota bacterium]